jgi:hypothetical protein
MAFDPDYMPKELKIVYAYMWLAQQYNSIAFSDLSKTLGFNIETRIWDENIVLSASAPHPSSDLGSLTRDFILIIHGKYGSTAPYTSALRITERTPARIVIVYDPIQDSDDLSKVEKIIGIKIENWPFSPKSQISFFPWDKTAGDGSCYGLLNGSGRFGEYFKELAGVK